MKKFFVDPSVEVVSFETIETVTVSQPLIYNSEEGPAAEADFEGITENFFEL